MKFKRLQSRIAVIFLSLILLIQVIGSVAIRLSIEKNARASVEEQLLVGEKVFVSLLEQNGQSLSLGARILASDYGFRQAIASNDYETILSALSNHQSRIGADIAIFYSLNSEKLTISGNLSNEEAKRKVDQLISGDSSNSASAFTIFKNQPYQLVAVPIKAPVTIGWIVMGFEINNALTQQLNKLSNLEVTFISKSKGSTWASTASTLSMVNARQLVALSPITIAPDTHNGEIEIADTAYGTRYVKIFEDNGQMLYAVLQRSINEATAPYRTLQLNLLILTILGALVFTASIFYISKRITQPITELANTAKMLEHGNYNIHIQQSIEREDELGRLSRAFNSMSDAIASREQSILKLAYWDEMTQLPNRASFMDKLAKAMLYAQDHHESLSIVVLNLDRFKQINKVLGQHAGDQLLLGVAERITASIRRSSDVIARFGGDEFAILLPGADSSVGLSVAGTVLSTLEMPIQIDSHYVDISAAAGIATYPDHAEDEAQLLSHAELAMQTSKSKRAGAVVFDHSMDIDSQDNLSFASELKAAIANNELVFYVQPKLDLISNQVRSVEALIRWKHPEKGFLYPDQFIPFAEQSGYIRDISLWMLGEAARYGALWNADNVRLPIAINLSTRDLIDQDLPNKINSLLVLHNVDVAAISIEITESSIMDDPVRAEITLERLSAMGIPLSIDDFGTGYSSLAYLKRLPVDELKIDKSFVLKMEQDENDRKIVKSTIDLGHNLGLKVVAEGIENLAVWDLLKGMGCDFGQGYYMSKPMPADDFIPWLLQWRSATEAKLNT